ncbi:MAG TPA: HIT family protein [Candidatus Saccharimonadales bacterium]|nr:HIT family protein [Candidatus Saccharimonadales bacterium]
MADKSLFEKIVDDEIPSWKVWEDDTYLAFLTPFPNTPGVTVVVPKKNPGDYIVELDPETAHGLLDAAAKVAKLLEKALGVGRVGIAFEGSGVAHVHAKLYPFHGELGSRHMTNVWSGHQEFVPHYRGYFSTSEGPRMSDGELSEIQRKIRKVAE